MQKKVLTSKKIDKSKNLNVRKARKGRFKSLIIEKDFEPENPKQLEELDENTCKWPIGHPNEKNFYFCGRTSLKDFSYCKLHLLYAFQPKNKKKKMLLIKIVKFQNLYKRKLNQLNNFFFAILNSFLLIVPSS